MTKVKGQGSIVTASFDGKSKSLFPSLKASEFFGGVKNLVLLSIKGNDYCRGDYLGSIIAQSLEKYEFTTFLIADEIYWHNLKSLEMPSVLEENNLKELAIAHGEQYFTEQLSHFLKPLGLEPDKFRVDHAVESTTEKVQHINMLARTHKFEILFWKDWVARVPAYIQSNINDYMDVYTTNPKLKRTLHEQAENFARRHANQAEGPEPQDLLYMRSHGYLKEESFYIIWLSAFLNYNFIVYPGEMPKPFAATKEYFVQSSDTTEPASEQFVRSDRPDRLANWLEVNFTRRPEPQDNIKRIKQNHHGFFNSAMGAVKSANTGSIPEGNVPKSFDGPKNKNIAKANNELAEKELATTMVGVTKVVLEGPLCYEFKKLFIGQLIDLLSLESPMLAPESLIPDSATNQPILAEIHSAGMSS